MSEQSSNNQKSTVLAEIYSQQQSSARLESRSGTVWQRMYAYFQQPRVIDQWLTGGILFFGIGGLLFGFLFFQYSLRAPYVRSVDGEKKQLTVEQKDQDLLGLRTKDTDGDGLTDYDELNIFGTGSYLADSDSDGLDDKLEITRGTDPLCAAGQNCFYNDLYAAQANEPVPISGQPSKPATLDDLRKA